MPTIGHFDGITIIMHLKEKEHNPPHVHAVTPNHTAPFSIKTGEKLYETEFPSWEAKKVKEFILANQEALLEMWETGMYKKIETVK